MADQSLTKFGVELPLKITKTITKTVFWISRSFKVINDEKLVSNACYGNPHVHVDLQPFSR